jgi:hypothetical protein
LRLFPYLLPKKEGSCIGTATINLAVEGTMAFLFVDKEIV